MNLRKLFLLLTCIQCLTASAQWKWMDPTQADRPVIQNQGWVNEIGKTYVRLPDRAKANVREPLWNLSRNSAGLAIYFYTNATEIKVRYTVKEPLSMPHMPATGVSGVDLYSIDAEGK